MSKIYLQNPEKTQIQVFETENQIGDSFITWKELTEGEIVKYELEKVKQHKFSQIETLKKSILYASLQYKAITLKASETAQNNIVGSLVVPFEKIKWLDASGNVIELSFNEFKEIRNIIAERTFLCNETAAILIKQVSTSEKVADIDAINIEAEFAKINKIIEIA